MPPRSGGIMFKYRQYYTFDLEQHTFAFDFFQNRNDFFNDLTFHSICLFSLFGNFIIERLFEHFNTFLNAPKALSHNQDFEKIFFKKEKNYENNRNKMPRLRRFNVF